MGAARRNLELKARDHDPEGSLKLCQGLRGGQDGGTLIQRDTYFETTRGRLKLREEARAGTDAHLIAYERPDVTGQKESHYRIVKVEDPRELREALSAVLGISVVVRKTRRLFLFEGIRIHLDHVDGLGDFIEFEGVAAYDGDDPRRFASLLSDLRRVLRIEPGDLLRGSYSDLLRAVGA